METNDEHKSGNAIAKFIKQTTKHFYEEDGLGWMKNKIGEKREIYAERIVNFGYMLLIVGSVVASYLEFNRIYNDTDRSSQGVSLSDKINK